MMCSFRSSRADSGLSGVIPAEEESSTGVDAGVVSCWFSDVEGVDDAGDSLVWPGRVRLGAIDDAVSWKNCSRLVS